MQVQSQNEFLSLNDLEYVDNKILGEGGFGSVKLVRLKGKDKKYALKKVDLSTQTPNELEHIKSEIQNHLKLRHPHIIKFNGTIFEGKNQYMLLDYAPNGDLYSRMMKIKQFSEYEATKIIFQTLQGLIYIHDKNIIHRDLKPENILIDKDQNCLITDFGWSGDQDIKRRQTYCGTYEYMAPEVVSGGIQDDKVDIWSLGVLQYELMHGKTPFKAATPYEINKKTLEGSIAISSGLSPEIKHFLKSTLRHHAKNRPSARKLLTHQLFSKHKMAISGHQSRPKDVQSSNSRPQTVQSPTKPQNQYSNNPSMVSNNPSMISNNPSMISNNSNNQPLNQQVTETKVYTKDGNTVLEKRYTQPPIIHKVEDGKRGSISRSVVQQEDNRSPSPVKGPFVKKTSITNQIDKPEDMSPTKPNGGWDIHKLNEKKKCYKPDSVPDFNNSNSKNPQPVVMYNNFSKNNQGVYIKQEKPPMNQMNQNLQANYKVKEEQGSYLEGISKGNHGSNGSDCGSPQNVHRRANMQQQQQVYYFDKNQQVHLGQSPSRKLNQNESYVVSDKGYMNNDGVMRSGSQKHNKNGNSQGKVINEFVIRNDNQQDNRRQTAPNDNVLSFPQNYIQK